MIPYVVAAYLSIVLFLSPDSAFAKALIEPLQDSQAFQNYAKRSKNELSKLLYLVELFKDTGHQVIVDGREYDSKESLPFARKYLAQHYKKENAERWVRKHCYRRRGSGQIMYFRYEDGSQVPLSEAMLEELTRLESIVGK